MSGQLRALKNRIKSVENTKKITRAMEMVAASKLRRFQDMMVKARPFTERLENLVKRVGTSSVRHPFFENREEKRAALVLFTSDTGLCGSYNNDLVEIARRFLAEKEKPFLIGVGKSGITALKRRGYACDATFTDTRASRVEEILKDLKLLLEKIYLEKKVDAIYVTYSHFVSVTTYQGVTQKLLPLETAKEAVKDTTDYIFEPSPEVIFQKLIPMFFEARTRTIFLESFVSEQIARMRAMHQATENAKEMIDSLVLERNKARQASITKELIEIVSGSRALKIK